MAAAHRSDRIRLLTLNVLSAEYADWPARRQRIRDGIARLGPDVVALQEVRDEDAAHLLGPGFHLARHPWAGDDGVTAVLACRWPVGVVHLVELDVTPRVRQFPWAGAVVAEVRAPAPIGPLLVVHHKPDYQLGHERERELQAVRTARAVEGLVGAAEVRPHVVLLGDLDATPDSAAIRFWTGRQSLDGTSVIYHDAWESARPTEAGHTFTPDNPLVRAGSMPLVRPRRIDYVLVRGVDHGPTLRVAACDLAFAGGHREPPVSDHYGVVADLVVPQRAPGTAATGFLDHAHI